MKKLLSLTIICFFFLYYNAHCQIIPKQFQDIINSSDYIFEGKVIRSDGYWNTSNTFIYTSHTLEIAKIFKGDLVCGTVEIITEGGLVGDKELTISHTLRLRPNEIGIFCCRNTSFEPSPIDFYTETNNLVLEVTYSEQGYYKYYFDDINPQVVSSFYDFDSLAQAYDAIELYTQINYIDCNSSIAFPQTPHSILNVKRIAYFFN